MLHVQTEAAVKLQSDTDTAETQQILNQSYTVIQTNTAETQQILNTKAGDRIERIKSQWGRNLDCSLETCQVQDRERYRGKRI